MFRVKVAATWLEEHFRHHTATVFGSSDISLRLFHRQRSCTLDVQFICTKMFFVGLGSLRPTCAKKDQHLPSRTPFLRYLPFTTYVHPTVQRLVYYMQSLIALSCSRACSCKRQSSGRRSHLNADSAQVGVLDRPSINFLYFVSHTRRIHRSIPAS